MVNSGDITVTNHRLRKAMTSLNDDDFNAKSKKLSDDLKSELTLKIGKVLEICTDTEKATVQINNSSEKKTCLIAHDIFSEGMNITGFPKGKSEIRHKEHYIIPSDNLYGVIATVKDKKTTKNILLSYINHNEWTNQDRVGAGEYKIQVGDNVISLTDKYIKINSENLFINGLPYTEAYKPLNDYYTKEDVEELINEKISKLDMTQINVLDNVYPVGSIYMSINNVNPSVIFGGSWESMSISTLNGNGSFINDFFFDATNNQITLKYDSADGESTLNVYMWKRLS